ncbi:DUF885 domain-containing protein [Engelhardtia mirabilis]|uniref:DUF885 domain-containing protein n=1 Tax=Engelhardtia mirabilis TaxID=2528011 RepID=A0A518BKX8_9BACT|nr:hypothetical protein Pla133_27190 [Planctomycetes bacterium Pla133]QDV01957.1 hypothetical protein Pla86_27180 [Planctomycetes bacterium Pla86]
MLRKSLRRSIFPVLLPGLLGLAACQSVQPPAPAEIGYWQEPAAGVETRELRLLVTQFWEGWIDWHPIEAAQLGDPVALGEWPAVADHVRGARQEQVWELRTKLGLLDPSHLSPSERMTYDVLLDAIEREKIELRAGTDRWMVDPVAGPHVRMLAVAREQPANTAYEREQLLERWSAFARALTSFERSAKERSGAGFTAPRGAIDRTVEQLDTLLAIDTFDSPFMTPACGGGRWVDLGPTETLANVAKRELGDALRNRELLLINRHVADPEVRASGTRVLLPSATDALDPDERGAFVESVREVIEQQIVPALRSWRQVLAFELAPEAPKPNRPGLVSMPSGTSIYRDLVRVHTTLQSDPGAFSRRAEADLTQIEDRLYGLAASALGVSGRAQLQTILRGDRSLFFNDATSIEAAMRSDVRRAQGSLRSWFLDDTAVPLVVGLAPALEPVDREAVSYRPPPADASRPGRLLIEASSDRQARYSTAAAAFGGGVPGRHLLRGLVGERPELALFRRYAGPEVLEIGWADYAEELADEMGLYPDDLSRVGMLARAALRRARAVTDVGLHLEGWSYADASAYLRAHSLLSPTEIDLELDLILARPAEALAAVAGGDALRDLREAAEQSLGAGFKVARFHEVVTAEGSISLPLLGKLVGTWAAIDGAAVVEP